MKIEFEFDDDAVSLVDTGGLGFEEYVTRHMREWLFCKTHFEARRIAKEQARREAPDHAAITKCSRVTKLLGDDHRKTEAVKAKKVN